MPPTHRYGCKKGTWARSPQWHPLGSLVTTLICGLVPFAALAQELPATVTARTHVLRVKPSTADPAVQDFDEPNLIVTNDQSAIDAPLAVFLPGTGGRPENVQRLLAVISTLGYRAIGLEYNDDPAVVQVCPRDPDPRCSENFRQQRVFGNAERAPVANPVAESIVQRLVMLLRHLDRQDPAGGWRQYLDGDEPAWPRLVVSGLSQGAGMAAYIAKRRPVARVVLFSSPWDFQLPGRTLAPWLAGPSVTPPQRWFAEFHRRENTAALLEKAYQALKIPDDHVTVFDLDLPAGSSGPNPFHGSSVRLPGYTARWQWLYGAASDLK